MEKTIVTNDLSLFSDNQLKDAERLLKSMRKNKSYYDFAQKDVELMVNLKSGFVFLTNSENQNLMIKKSKKLKLGIWYKSPYSSNEGFLEDLFDYYLYMEEEEKEWFKELYLKEGKGKILPLIDFNGDPIFEKGIYFILKNEIKTISKCILDSHSYENNEYSRDKSEIFKSHPDAVAEMTKYINKQK